MRPLLKYRLHPECFGFALLFAAGAYALGHFVHPVLGWMASLSVVWCLYFFRVPFRRPPEGEQFIVSAADGKVVSVKEVIPPAEFGLGSEPRTRISVFLNIFDVHVNFIPVGGVITHSYYEQGHFFNAAKDKASEHNEKNALAIQLPSNSGSGEPDTLGVVQIAGLVARRIRCDVHAGDTVTRGQCYGLIRFGSRQDIYLPYGVKPLVYVGQHVVAAETILADLTSRDQA